MPCGCHFDMIDDTLFDMTLFEMTVNSGSSFEMTFVSKSRKKSERLSIRYDAGLSLRYDRANMTVVFKWHTAPVDCESVRGSQIFLLWNFRPEIRSCCLRFQTKTVESMAMPFKTKRSKIWLFAVTVEWLAIAFKTNTVENMAIRDYGRKIDYHFKMNTVGSLAIRFNGRKYGHTRLRSKVWLSFSSRIRSNLWLLPIVTKMDNMLEKMVDKKLEIASIMDKYMENMMEKKMDILKWIKRWICAKLEKSMDIGAISASNAFIPRSAWQRASGGTVVDRRRQGYGFASRLSDEKVYRTAHSL